MEWKEALYTLNDRGVFTAQEIESLIKLPEIRDEIFFPDYEQYNYYGVESVFGSVFLPYNMFKIDFSLISIKVNRRLTLAFVFKEDEIVENAVITDMIAILDKKEGWDIMIEMDILIKKAGKDVKFDYWRLSSYPGSLEEKITACLKQIKYNYDTYALDIISGENWDAHDTNYY